MRAKAAAMATTAAAAETADDVTAEPADKTTAAAKPADASAAVPAAPTSSAASTPTVNAETTKVVTPATAQPPVASKTSLPPAAKAPLPPDEARARSVQNMERIAAALLAYVDEHKSLPNAATVVTRGEQEVPLLSWRVKLLPYLGYESLYKQFRQNEPWDSAHNKKLLPQIPPEYQSPDRFDASTNYVVPVGVQTAFSGGRGRIPAHFTGGAENVAMLVEVDDAQAVPWTAPQDLPYQAAAPRAGLGSLRPDGALVALASGRVGRIAPDVSDAQLRELFTIGEDSSPAGAYVKPANSSMPAATVAPMVPGVAAGSAAGSKEAHSARPTSPVSVKSSPTPPATALNLSELFPPKPARLAVPEEQQLRAARTLLRDVYAADYEAAKTLPARQTLVRRMLADARSLIAEPAEYYELLRTTRDVAISAGMLDESQEAVRLLAEQFEVDGLALRAQALGELRKAARTPTEAKRLAEQAQRLLRDALRDDHFAAAGDAHEVGVAALRLGGDRAGAVRAEQRREVIDAIREAHAAVPQAIAALKTTPDDPQANAIVGKYYCLVKQRWDEFLPLLAKGDDVRLRVVATIDLEGSADPEAVLQLADQYWDLAEYYPRPFDLGLKMRAVHYYSAAISQHPGGLAKIRAEKRLQQWRDKPDWAVLLEPVEARDIPPPVD